MRIIAGELGGRNFEAKGTATHPMSDKIRGALFNVLGDIEGLEFLDCFSGTGAISFEAISRGASYSTAIESNKVAQQNIADNIMRLNLKSKISLIRSTVQNWTQNNRTKRFDIIVCDPPFDRLQLSTILQLEELLRKKSLLVLSLPKSSELPSFENLAVVEEKKYGDSKLVFYRNNQ